MIYFFVFVLALGAGALVFWLTLRTGAPEPGPAPLDGDGFLPEPPPSASLRPAPDGVYVPIIADRHSWQTRLTGFVGLVIVVSLAAVALAFALYEAGSAIARLITDYAS